MGQWIIEPGQVHHHEFPDISGYALRDAIGAKWQCDCGAKFKYAVKIEDRFSGEPIGGGWEYIKRSFAA